MSATTASAEDLACLTGSTGRCFHVLLLHARCSPAIAFVTYTNLAACAASQHLRAAPPSFIAYQFLANDSHRLRCWTVSFFAVP
ncbi:hypothetical protein [Nocardia salmonicida]|uniref:hypothetical protein n=1 Tax=Nocardia salmonicida TaxID=53431 RepID=UPI0037AF4704